MRHIMNAILITVFGIVALAVIAWQTWRESARGAAQIAPEWLVVLGRIANAQALGHHREVRRGVLQGLLKLKREQPDSRAANHVCISLAALLAKDPVYPEVVRAIRSACKDEPAVSELALCVGLRQFLIEDIRQCEEIAENFGHIRRSEQGAESLLIARFHATT